MRAILASCLLLVVGCSNVPTLPSPALTSPLVLRFLKTPEAVETYRVTGPRGCSQRDDLPEVVRWTVWRNDLYNHKINKGYNWDDTPGCEPIEGTAWLRTQNPHLRWHQVSDDLIEAEYDRDTYNCRGRTQVDIDIDGNDLVIWLVIDNPSGDICLPPPPTCATDPSLCPPVPTCPQGVGQCHEPPKPCKKGGVCR